jgi:hypothetical protein
MMLQDVWLSRFALSRLKDEDSRLNEAERPTPRALRYGGVVTMILVMQLQPVFIL